MKKKYFNSKNLTLIHAFTIAISSSLLLDCLYVKTYSFSELVKGINNLAASSSGLISTYLIIKIRYQ